LKQGICDRIFSFFKKTANFFRQKNNFTDTENRCSTSGVAQEKRKDRMKLSLPPKLEEKTSLHHPSYFIFAKKNFITSYAFDALFSAC
jgi:hypothetical protein